MKNTLLQEGKSGLSQHLSASQRTHKGSPPGEAYSKLSPIGKMNHATQKDEQVNMRSAFFIIWRMIIALAAGLVLGLLVILLYSHLNWSIAFDPLFFSPLLLLGVVGRLIAGPPKKPRELLLGLGIGGLSWFGIWLTVLVWDSFQPQTVYDCFHADPPCSPTTVPFWGPYVLIDLFAFFLFLVVGLVFVIVGVVVTSIVLDAIHQRANRPESSL